MVIWNSRFTYTPTVVRCYCACATNSFGGTPSFNLSSEIELISKQQKVWKMSAPYKCYYKNSEVFVRLHHKNCICANNWMNFVLKYVNFWCYCCWRLCCCCWCSIQPLQITPGHACTNIFCRRSGASGRISPRISTCCTLRFTCVLSFFEITMVAGLYARSVNHSCSPNMEARIVKNRYLIFVALRDLSGNEELTKEWVSFFVCVTTCKPNIILQLSCRKAWKTPQGKAET